MDHGLGGSVRLRPVYSCLCFWGDSVKKPSGRIDRRYIPMLWAVPLGLVTAEMVALNVRRTGWLIMQDHMRHKTIDQWAMSVTHEMLHRVHDRHSPYWEWWLENKAAALLENPRWAAEVYKRIAFVCAQDLRTLTPEREKRVVFTPEARRR